MSFDDWAGLVTILSLAFLSYFALDGRGERDSGPRWRLTFATTAAGIGSLIHIFDLDRTEVDASRGVTVGMALMVLASIVLARHERRRLRTEASLWVGGWAFAVCALSLL